jgi:hypothetical protein
VLDFLTDVVGRGTVLIFHDWFRFRAAHFATTGLPRWLARNPHLELIDHWRQVPRRSIYRELEVVAGRITSGSSSHAPTSACRPVRKPIAPNHQ